MQNEGSEQDIGAEDEVERRPSLERVELPDHASAYYSPVPPPATTQHQTIEIEAVRLDPELVLDAADVADTQRIPAHELPSTDRNAPTLMLRAVPRPAEPSGKRPALAIGLAALAIGAMGVLLWSVASPDDKAVAPTPSEVVRPPAAVGAPRASEPSPERVARAAAPAPEPADIQAPKPPIAVPPRRVATEGKAARGAFPTAAGAAKAAGVAPAPTAVRASASLAAVEPEPEPGPSASAQGAVNSPRPWLKTEAPKAWLK